VVIGGAWRARLLKPRIWAPLASTALAAALLLMIFFPRVEPDFADLARIEPLPYVTIATRAAGDDTDLLRERGLDAYSAGEFERAARLLQSYLARDGIGDEQGRIHLYLGVSLLLAGQAMDARGPLAIAADSALPPLRERARWYLAQCALLRGDPVEAELHLGVLESEGLSYTEAAAGQLTALRQMLRDGD
jgi:hypothetical protein